MLQRFHFDNKVNSRSGVNHQSEGDRFYQDGVPVVGCCCVFSVHDTGEEDDSDFLFSELELLIESSH